MNETNNTNSTITIGRDILMILLAIASVGLLIFEVTAELTSEQSRTIQMVDLLISLIFLSEYIFSIVKAKRKWHYAISHWYDLLASIPVTEETFRIMRGLRLLRIIRVVRLFRIFRLAIRFKKILEKSNKFAKDSKLIYIAIISFSTVLFSALAFHYFESDVNENVNSFFDSFWWAMVTVTTIGYGDIYPVTTTGRIIAMILMLVGIGTLGTFTASIAGYVFKEKSKD